MIAILLCAGFGTRLYPLTRHQAKALLPVAGRPVLDYLLDQMAAFIGLEAVHVAANGRDYAAFAHWARSQDRPWPIFLHNNGTMRPEARLGAVGDLDRLLQSIGLPAGALVAAGDNILRFSLQPAWEAFVTGRRNLVLALLEPDPARRRRSGVLELDGADRVVALHEKPASPPSPWIAPPFYFLRREALALVHPFRQEAPAADAPGHLLAYLVARQPVYALRTDGRRFDIGDAADYLQAQQALASGEEPLPPWPPASGADV